MKNTKTSSLSVYKRPFPCNNTYTCYKNVLHYFSLLVFFVEFVMFRLLRLVTFLLRLEFFSAIRWSFFISLAMWIHCRTLELRCATHTLYSAPVLSPWMELPAEKLIFRKLDWTEYCWGYKYQNANSISHFIYEKARRAHE